MPYSIPLWTILTKWPAPLGPQCRYPCSAVPPTFSRPGVRGTSPLPGASVGEDRVETRHHFLLAADHHAVAPLQAPDTAARPHVDVVDALRRELLGAPYVVHVVRIAAVDEDVAGLERGQQLGDGRVDHGRRDHQPDSARLGELAHQVGE